ncbi:MAG: bifunctional DNA-formamidopyrimidine glycosylase/DNA-(apurinic or apyrimidinic site) lyase [Propionibacteriaceae bacterium]|jgi:formamidopyrimidine-DNA glycosylase|nr:bifunctional DNA-formamidopyrimidine glycosylase/DNA-(apurinic or apyrimidinic site) lyase [Propionibacteriaceae bacterium]
MPELPEVETVRRGLETLILGRRILTVDIRHEKSFADDDLVEPFVTGARVTGLRRYAKVLVIDLDTAYSLVIHLKMTGQLVFRDEADAEADWGAGHPTKSFVAALPDRSTRVVFGLGERADASADDVLPDVAHTHLFFNDQRIFGWIKVVPTPAVEQLPFIAGLGPQPLDARGEPLAPAAQAAAEARFLTAARRHARAPVKAVILDQAVAAGIGNIYADEALWAARIHPATRVGDLTDQQLVAVFRAAGESMLDSLAVGGSTMATYFQVDGTPGSYLDQFAQVFRREGRPCPRCGTLIVKTRVAGRGTHLCPTCQLPRPPA